MIRQATTVLLLAMTAVVAPAAPPAAAAVDGLPGFCPDGDGVTVVVDFNELGGGTVIRCAVGAQSNGLAALENAGFSVTGTERWGKAFVCRIGGKPGSDTEACRNTPPASAYWSYWHAPNEGGWKYSDVGVLNRTPPAGSFEGWSFAKGTGPTSAPPPGVSPRRPVAAPPPQPPPPPVPPGGQPQTSAPAVVAASSVPGSPSVGPSASVTSNTPSPSQEWTGDLAEPPPVSPGTPTGVFAAAGLLIVILVAAMWIRRRRRILS
jgi:hypothetical protein